MSKRTFLTSFSALLAVLCAVPAEAHVLFVDDSAPAGGNGSSWARAFNDLARALQSPGIPDVEQVWVAEGRYVPSPTDPGMSFEVPDGVSVYGGFAGTETRLEQRDPGLHPSVLDGDLNGDDLPGCAGRTDNSEHVVTDAGGASTHLDGFTIRGGRRGPGAGLFLTADVVVLRQLVIEQNCDPSVISSGAGAEVRASTVVVEDCVVRENEAGDGGGMSLERPRTAFFSDCLFERNRATAGGGLSLDAPRTTFFSDCRFVENEASDGSAAKLVQPREAFFTGCDFERNDAGGGDSVHLVGPQSGRVHFRDCQFLDTVAGRDARLSPGRMPVSVPPGLAVFVHAQAIVMKGIGVASSSYVPLSS